jgi:UDP-N-acetylmuramyl pentapeptide phosphotransferase/UDP-N-acetylglucosamine-1-phosphate transferase
MTKTQIAALVGFATTLTLCVMLVLTKRWHGKLTLDGTDGVQKFHTAPTPRVGGIGLLLGLSAAWSILPHDHAVEDLLGPMLLAGLPAFLFGTAEDLTKRVGVRERLLATMASGVLAWWITDIGITRVDLWAIDALLTWVPLSVAFTAFAVGGVANAVNIIDGFNGLASGVLIICFCAIGLIAQQAGDAHLTQVCLVLASVTAGFLLVNFPFGKIFLGDGGAYLMGFLLAWVAVLLPARNPAVSPWAALLACGYPILEVLFSIWRRHQRDLHPGHPDRLHMHSLVKSRMVRKHLLHLPGVLRNASVSPLIWIFSTVPASLSVVFAHSTGWLIGSFVLSAVLYAVFYSKLVYFGWKLPKFF